MADTFQFDLVSPERRLASVEATSVLVPGAEGDMTVMASHAPTITSLRPGLLRVEGNGGQQEYVVTGGFAELGEDGVTVLAERALPRGEVTQEIMNDMVREAVASHKAAQDRAEDGVDEAAKLVADMVAMGTHIGLDPHQPSL